MPNFEPNIEPVPRPPNALERKTIFLEVVNHEEFVEVDIATKTPIKGTEIAFLHLKAPDGSTAKVQIPHHWLGNILALQFPNEPYTGKEMVERLLKLATPDTKRIWLSQYDMATVRMYGRDALELETMKDRILLGHWATATPTKERAFQVIELWESRKIPQAHVLLGKDGDNDIECLRRGSDPNLLPDPRQLIHIIIP